MVDVAVRPVINGNLSLSDATPKYLPSLQGSKSGSVSLLDLGTHTAVDTACERQQEHGDALDAPHTRASLLCRLHGFYVAGRVPGLTAIASEPFAHADGVMFCREPPYIDASSIAR
ncbi:hypothetical protein CIC12_29715 [Burkholderia sp. SG-MS1]|uniref:hypothetical protein n=1 Tax=Paraburkholderia sp. SG-MS1 TaxID=2023741 RepID=UPI0014464C71|nr:hypothetical protein [Paraburkholderia sp. SG-MS1]NKJ50827.1 hypothetical protein [Paraburkholderia sp. SG-MS1]